MGLCEDLSHFLSYIPEWRALECDPMPWMAFRNKRMHLVGCRALHSDFRSIPVSLHRADFDVFELHPFKVPRVRPQCTPALATPTCAAVQRPAHTPAPSVFIHPTYTAPPAPGPAQQLAQGSNTPHGMHLLQVHRISDELQRRLCNAD
jgi:hypothetical protein